MEPNADRIVCITSCRKDQIRDTASGVCKCANPSFQNFCLNSICKCSCPAGSYASSADPNTALCPNCAPVLCSAGCGLSLLCVSQGTANPTPGGTCQPCPLRATSINAIPGGDGWYVLCCPLAASHNNCFSGERKAASVSPDWVVFVLIPFKFTLLL